MFKQEHLEVIQQGVKVWNQWRKEHPEIRPSFHCANLSKADLREADLSDADLRIVHFEEANLRGANLRGANLRWAHLHRTNLCVAYLQGAILRQADLSQANLKGAELHGVDFTQANLGQANLIQVGLYGANFTNADLSGANLSKADLSAVSLVQTNLTGVDLTGCRVYGLSAWDVNLTGAIQKNLIITGEDQPIITVDNLEVAQFIYLLLNNQKIRNVIDTITSKVVLILGRFTPQRKAILDAIREELRHRDYLPVLFDFDKPSSRDITETVSTLAHLARFVIADLTEAKSIPQELMRIVPTLPSLPIQPLLHISDKEYGMFEHFKRFPWVLDTYFYESVESVCTALSNKVIEPAEAMAKALAQT